MATMVDHPSPTMPNENQNLFSDGRLDSSQPFAFSEKSVRQGFIRKVYGILICQMTVSMLFIVLFLYVRAISEFSQRNPWFWGVAFAVTIICLIVLACFPNVRRRSPLNVVFLAIFTLCESILLGAVASCYESREVLMAVGITSVIALGLTIFAFQTKWDFTMCSGALLVLLIILILFAILCAFIKSNILGILYASLGALVFSMYLVFDTQLMLGGKHQYALSPEEYVFAALNLYLDIVNLFAFILSIVGSARG